MTYVIAATGRLLTGSRLRVSPSGGRVHECMQRKPTRRHMDTLINDVTVRHTTGQLSLGEPVVHDGLTIVPILDPTAVDPGWLLLEEVLALGSAEVTEVNQAGSVPTLTVRNDSDSVIFLLDGEELIGAKQNRILNTTVLVPAHQSLQIPVSCVEVGRWGYRTRSFQASARGLYASVRRNKTVQVHDALHQMKTRTANQG